MTTCKQFIAKYSISKRGLPKRILSSRECKHIIEALNKFYRGKK